MLDDKLTGRKAFIENQNKKRDQILTPSKITRAGVSGRKGGNVLRDFPDACGTWISPQRQTIDLLDMDKMI